MYILSVCQTFSLFFWLDKNLFKFKYYIIIIFGSLKINNGIIFMYRYIFRIELQIIVILDNLNFNMNTNFKYKFIVERRDFIAKRSASKLKKDVVQYLEYSFVICFNELLIYFIKFINLIKTSIFHKLKN